MMTVARVATLGTPRTDSRTMIDRRVLRETVQAQPGLSGACALAVGEVSG